MLIQLPVSSSHAMLSISTALCPLHSEVTALEESCHPERSVLGEVKDLQTAKLRFFTAAKCAAVQNDEAFVIRSKAKTLP
jgi:hypothetical protein